MRLYQPADPLLVRVHDRQGLVRLCDGYPWPVEPSEDDFIRAVNERKLPPLELRRVNALRITLETEGAPETGESAALRRQLECDLMENVIRGLGLWTVSGIVTDDAIYANRSLPGETVTRQHWTAALDHWLRRGPDDESGARTVDPSPDLYGRQQLVYWHRPTRGDRQYHFRIEHRPWLPGEENQFVRLSAYWRWGPPDSRRRPEPVARALFHWKRP